MILQGGPNKVGVGCKNRVMRGLDRRDALSWAERVAPMIIGHSFRPHVKGRLLSKKHSAHGLRVAVRLRPGLHLP